MQPTSVLEIACPACGETLDAPMRIESTVHAADGQIIGTLRLDSSAIASHGDAHKSVA